MSYVGLFWIGSTYLLQLNLTQTGLLLIGLVCYVNLCQEVMGIKGDNIWKTRVDEGLAMITSWNRAQFIFRLLILVCYAVAKAKDDKVARFLIGLIETSMAMVVVVIGRPIETITLGEEWWGHVKLEGPINLLRWKRKAWWMWRDEMGMWARMMLDK